MAFNGTPANDRRIRRASAQRRRGLFITAQQELALYEQSDGLCAMCYERPAEVIDHCHETGAPRGALCRPCNQGLGLLGDSERNIMNAIDYLQTSSAVEV